MRILGICYRNTKCVGALLEGADFQGVAGLTTLIPDPTWPPDLIARVMSTHGPVELRSLDMLVVEWPSTDTQPVDFKRDQEQFHANVQAMFALQHVDKVYALQRKKLQHLLAAQTAAISNGQAPQRVEDYIDWYLHHHTGIAWDERNERPEYPGLWSPPCREALFVAQFGLLPGADTKIYNYRYYNPYIGENWTR